MNKGRDVFINNQKFSSILAACRYLRINPVTIRRWLNKYGNEFKTGDLEIRIK